MSILSRKVMPFITVAGLFYLASITAGAPLLLSSVFFGLLIVSFCFAELGLVGAMINTLYSFTSYILQSQNLDNTHTAHTNTAIVQEELDAMLAEEKAETERVRAKALEQKRLSTEKTLRVQAEVEAKLKQLKIDNQRKISEAKAQHEKEMNEYRANLQTTKQNPKDVPMGLLMFASTTPEDVQSESLSACDVRITN